MIRDELAQYDERLAQRPEIVVVSKAELSGADDIQQQLEAVADGEVLLISAVTGQGLDQLVRQAASLVEAERQQSP